MAVKNYEPSRLKIERFLSCDLYTGTAVELIAAKIVAECDLPGQPGNGKLTVTCGKGCEPGNLKITRRPRKRTPDLFVVRIGTSPDEEALRQNAEQTERRENSEIARTEILRKVQARIKEHNKSATGADFLGFLRGLINMAAWAVHDHTDGMAARNEPSYGFRLEQSKGCEAVRLLNLAHDSLARAKAVQDKSSQNAAPFEVFEQVLKDQGFQRFLELQGLR